MPGIDKTREWIKPDDETVSVHAPQPERAETSVFSEARLALVGDELFMTWAEGGGYLYASRWSDGEWTPLSSDHLNDKNGAMPMRLTLDGQQRPVISWRS